jgi:hypothetical protein
MDMHRTTLNIPNDLFRRAKLKATSEDLPLSEVVRSLLDRWVEGAIPLDAEGRSRRELVRRARESFGVWRDRDPDEWLRSSRQGLSERDVEVADARVAS